MMRQPTPDILAGLGQADDGGLAAAMGPQAERVATVKIRLDGGTQPRAGIDQAVVDDYYQDMANGAQFPPVELVYDGMDYWLWDGFHRFAAFCRDGDRTIPAHVRQGTRRDAVLLSVGANAAHGFRRTNGDKRRAVMALLEDEEWCQWSDREIARRCAVSQPFVSSLRHPAWLSREKKPAASDNDYQIEKRRVIRNGTEYTMTSPQRSAAPAVAAQGGNYATRDDLDAAVRSWLVAYDTHEEKEAALMEVMELGENSVTFDDLREWIGSVKPRRSADLIQAAERVLIQLLQGVVNERAAPRVAEPFVPADIEEQVEQEVQMGPPDRPMPEGVLVGTWRCLCATRWEKARIKCPYCGVRNLTFDLPPWIRECGWEMFQMPTGSWRGRHATLGTVETADDHLGLQMEMRRLSEAAATQQPQVPPEPAPQRGREMEFETKQINQGKTIKIFGRNMDGTLTVTLDKDKLHLYSPGVTMTPGDAYDLTVRMQRALAQMHLAKQKETNHA